MTPNRIDFVNEDDAWSIFLTLLKQIAHAARAHAHEHLNKVRTGDGKEWNIRLARNRASQQGLASSRRSDEQHTLRNSAAQFLELLRLAQKFDNFAKFFLRLIHARHVFKRDLFLLHGEQTRPALAKGRGLVAAGLHLADHEEPQGAEQYQGRQVQNPTGPGAVADVLEAIRDILVRQLLVHVRVVDRNDCVEGRIVLKLPAHFLADEYDVVDIALIHVS